MTFNMRHASPARLQSRLVSSRLLCCCFVSWLLGVVFWVSTPHSSLALPLPLCVRFLFHFTSFEGWNSIYLKTHQTANFMNLQRFGFCSSQVSASAQPPSPPHYSAPLLLDIFSTPPPLHSGSLRGDNCLAACVSCVSVIEKPSCCFVGGREGTREAAAKTAAIGSAAERGKWSSRRANAKSNHRKERASELEVWHGRTPFALIMAPRFGVELPVASC